MIIDGMDFDDDLSVVQGRENLWRSVLMNAIEEAVTGIRCSANMSHAARVRMTVEARTYITVPNKDFDTVCSLAGLDPEAVRERVIRQIAEAPTPEELVLTSRRTMNPTAKKPGPKPRADARRFEHDGKNLTIAEWSELSGVKAAAIHQRLRNGWSISRAIEKTDGRTTRVRISGKRVHLPRPGVVSNLPELMGTGGGRHAHEISEISFSDQKAPTA